MSKRFVVELPEDAFGDIWNLGDGVENNAERIRSILKHAHFEVGGIIEESSVDADGTIVIEKFQSEEISLVPLYNSRPKGKMTTIPMVNAETGEPVHAAYIDGGLTAEERVIMSHLVDAWNNFVVIENISDSLKKEFSEGINKCQMVLGQLVLSRLFPDYWNDK